MQDVTQYWDDTNRSNFTSRPIVSIRIERADGISTFITNADLISFSHIKSGDTLCGIITQDKIVFTANNTNGNLDYDAESERDVYANAMCVVNEMFVTPVSPFYESIDGGVYYISDIKEVKRGQQYQITALSVIGFMTEKAKNLINCTNAYQVVQSVINQAIASQEVPINSQTAFSNMCVCDQTELSGIGVSYLSTDSYSLAEVLQLVAAMASDILYVDRKGKIHIEKHPDTYDNYVLPTLTLYEPIDISYATRIGNVTIQSNHMSFVVGTDYQGDKIGGLQIANIPILNDESIATGLCDYIYDTLETGRKRFKLNCRFDPKLDIFDAITIPYDNKMYSAIITGINATYKGSWKADITAMSYGLQESEDEEETENE
jgi:hypothetical protein